MLMNIAGGGSVKLQEKTVEPSSQSINVKPDAGYVGLSQVTVEGDAKLIASNIKSGVTIFGVTGTGGLPTRTVTIERFERVMYGSEGYQSYGDMLTGSRTGYVLIPGGSMTGSGNGTTTGFTEGTITSTTVSGLDNLKYYGSLKTLDVSSLASKLMHLCPSGKTFNANISGVLVFVYPELIGNSSYQYGIAAQGSSTQTTATINISGNPTTYSTNLSGASNITYNTGWMNPLSMADYRESMVMGFILTGINYQLS